MSDSPIYIYIDSNTVEVHEEESYHQNPDGRTYVELRDPLLSISSDSPERLREFAARLYEWLATAREESASAQSPS